MQQEPLHLNFKSLSMLILQLFLRLERETEPVIGSQHLEQQYFCCVGGIILAFYNEKELTGLLAGNNLI